MLHWPARKNHLQEHFCKLNSMSYKLVVVVVVCLMAANEPVAISAKQFILGDLYRLETTSSLALIYKAHKSKRHLCVCVYWTQPLNLVWFSEWACRGIFTCTHKHIQIRLLARWELNLHAHTTTTTTTLSRKHTHAIRRHKRVYQAKQSNAKAKAS